MIKRIVLKNNNDQITTQIAAILPTNVSEEKIIINNIGKNIYLNVNGNETDISEISNFKPKYNSSLYLAINNKTDEILKTGFTWNNITFSLDQEHLSDYKDTVTYLKEGILQFPYEIKGDNNESIMLTTGNIDSFFNTGLTYKETITREGWNIKNSLSGKTELELLNFVDPRN